MSVSDDDVATYTAAMGFLIAEWLGALGMVASFTYLYVASFVLKTEARTAVYIGIVVLTIGAFMFWTNRRNYYAMNFPWRRRIEIAASVIAASGAVFWGLFALALALEWLGINVFPTLDP